MFIQWFTRGMCSFTVKDVADWMADATGRSHLREPQHQRAARLLLEGVVNVTNADSTMIPYVRLEREGRWRYMAIRPLRGWPARRVCACGDVVRHGRARSNSEGIIPNPRQREPTRRL